MPQIVAAAMAQAAVAAPAAAATTAAVLPTAAAGTAAAQTAAIEAAKQAAIQQGVKQAGLEAGKQAAVEAGKQAAVEASKQGLAQAGTQAAQQTGVEAMKQGIFSANPAGVPPTAGAPITPTGPATPLPPAGGAPNTLSANLSNQGIMTDAGLQTPGVEILPPKPGMSLEQAQALNAQIGARPTPMAFKDAAGLGNAPPAPELTQSFMPKAPYNDPGTFSRIASDKGVSDLTIRPASESMFKPTFETQFPLAEKSALEKGFETALGYVKDNPMSSGLAAISIGQYLNKPGEPDKSKYKNRVDMSGFQPSTPSAPSFTPSYEYQKYAAEGGLMGYAVGGPVEMMSAQNAVGDNTMYPQSQLQTPMYSNPAVQRPMAMNVISQGIDAPVDRYTGEQKFAEGGISEETAREYGLKSRKQRATKGLSQAYEDVEKDRAKELASIKSLGDKFDEGIVPRSRTQQLSSPYSAAIEEHNRLAKKTRTPKFEPAKTSLGDIDTYMDVPIEAASGGIMGNLGSYSDGGRLLRGPGDGVSDSIPAVIGKRQPARLADGEFVIPARIVSELGNGSTEAGARKLYAMMERIQNTRKKSIGKKKVAVNSRADKHLPA